MIIEYIVLYTAFELPSTAAQDNERLSGLRAMLFLVAVLKCSYLNWDIHLFLLCLITQKWCRPAAQYMTLTLDWVVSLHRRCESPVAGGEKAGLIIDKEMVKFGVLGVTRDRHLHSYFYFLCVQPIRPLPSPKSNFILKASTTNTHGCFSYDKFFSVAVP